MTDYLQMTDHFGKYAGCCHMLLDPVCDLHPLISHLVTELLHGLLSPDLLLLRNIAWMSGMLQEMAYFCGML